MNWYFTVWKKFAEFDGRARRKEYWFFILINLIVSIALTLVDNVFGLLTAAGVGVLSGLYTLAVIIPSLAVSARRLHDSGRTAWWLLLFLVPLIGPLVLLVFMVMGSQEGRNEYGENPITG